ncbi:hypothetical protein AAMO2058_000840200 [Amorphochlora amoebiformis]
MQFQNTLSTLKDLQTLPEDETRTIMKNNPELISNVRKTLVGLEAIEILDMSSKEMTAGLNVRNIGMASKSPETFKSTLRPSPDPKLPKWRPAVLPPDEDKRLEILRTLEILDTKAEQTFDGLLWLATTICGTEMGAVSLVDEHRQYFKAQRGLGCSETSRDVAFCSHTILQSDKLMYIEDAKQDIRFSDNPLVTSGPNIRFYAGVPMNIDEHNVGTLCVISAEAKRLSEKQKMSLAQLASLCRDQLLLRRKNMHLKHLVTELDTARMKALKCAEDRVKFLANMTHELRTPLNAIIGFAELIRDEQTQIPEGQKECIESIEFGARVLAKTVNSVLDFTKIDSGKWKLDLCEVDFPKILKSLSNLQGSVANSKKVKLKTTIDPTLHRNVKIDKTKTTQILNNLLSNAIKFTPPGKMVELTVDRYSSNKPLKFPDTTVVGGVFKATKGDREMTNHYVSLTVQDQGVGIAPEKLGKIFESFEQENNSTARMHGGTGLGLSIVKGIVRLCNGRIYLSSNKGGKDSGSRFSIVIPYTVTRNVEEKKVRKLSFKIPNNYKLVFAEDNKLSQKLIHRFLRKNGLSCTMCDNGKILVDQVRKILETQKKVIPIIFSDLWMPVMTGKEALVQLRILGQKYNKKLLVVALTASPESVIEDNSGFDFVLGKPMKFEKLISIVEQITERNTKQGPGSGVPYE